MRWTHVVFAIAVVAALGFVWLIVREGGQQVNALAAQVLPTERRSVVETFREYLASVKAAKGDELLVAEVRAVNEITREDTRREFWTGLSLGTSTVSVRYPVSYRYIIRISDRWRLRVDGNTVVVQRPVIRPLEPAIDTAGIDFQGGNGWLRWNKEEMRDQLLRQLTPDAVVRAAEHRATAAPHADAAITAFIRTWLLAATGNGSQDTVVVLADDVPGGVDITVGR